jgi:prolyl-tRNA synthetase family II
VRWSEAFIPTLRDDPADAEAISHKLLVRGGYVRQLMSGVYSMLPLGQRVRTKVMAIIEEEIDAIGGQQFLLPQLHPASIWEQTGRLDTMADIIMSFEDNKGGMIVLGPTHEEIFATVGAELTSYKQLPQLWYHIQTKFRDEARPKSGLLRVREFTMKDSYTFDVDSEGLDIQFDRHFAAYNRIFDRLGMDVVSVHASSGAMGGTASIEFMVRSDVGEDEVAACAACDYAANVETARSRLPDVVDPEGDVAIERFATPDVRTIADLEALDGGAAADLQIKTLVYILDGKPALVLVRGDHALQEQKLQDTTGSIEVRPAQADEIRELLGADAGSLGAVAVEDVTILADKELRGRRHMTTGANKNEFHVRGVDIERDIAVDDWLDLRTIEAGEECPECAGTLEVFPAIEVGHIFKLGTFYADKLGLSVLDENGKSMPIVMGSYGIGVERNMAASVEANHDDAGIIWPIGIAPYVVVITVVRPDDERSAEVSTALYEELTADGIDVLLDDRKERPGVKFADAELIGIPLRLTIGPRGLESNVVEFVDRRSSETREVAIGEAASEVKAFLGRT